MNELLFRSWWVLALRGVMGILFGALALLWPGLTLLALIALFAVYALFSGVASIVGALRSRRNADDWPLVFLLGVVGVATGVVAILRPDITVLALIFFIGAYAMLTGILDIAVAIRLRRQIRGEALIITTGLVSITFGIMAFLFPDAGALALVWLISVYAIATGMLLLLAGLRARSWLKPGAERRQHARRRNDGGGTVRDLRVHA
jgi:uncharacterized membrane protein HdeD (DUF308 family)